MKILVLADRRLRAEADGIKKLTEAFVQGLYTTSKSKKGADLIIEKIHINPCKGCNSCWQSSKGECANIGDMPHIAKVFQEAELVVWSLPLFYYSSPSIMKAFVGLKSNKKQQHVVISICSFLGNDKEDINKQFSDMYKDKYATILCSQGELFSIPQMKDKTDKYLIVVRKAGAEFAASSKFSPQIVKLLSLPLFNKEKYLLNKPKRV